MALTVGNTTTSASSTFSVTTSATADILIVGVSIRHAAGASGVLPSGITFDGNALTIGKVYTEGQVSTGIWYRVNPGVTTANVVVSYSSTPDSDLFWAMDFGGADTASPIGTTYGNSGASHESRNVTPVASNGSFISNVIGSNGTFTTGTTTAVRSDTDLAAATWYTAGGYVAHTGVDTTTVSWSWDGDDSVLHSIAEIKEYVPVAHSATIADTMTVADAQVTLAAFKITVAETLSVLEDVTASGVILWERQAKPATNWTNQNKP
jgi:hypothetical protein